MGQYYNPICIDTDVEKYWIYSHDYSNGLKLMEHSYVGNDFVGAVERLLTKGNPWYKKPLVWAGDYADTDEGQLRNLYDQCKDYFKIDSGVKPLNSRYIINHTKGLFVDKRKCPSETVTQGDESWDMTVHPLPLLTCEGNGRGGGDYRLENIHTGSWARNVISVSNKKPTGFKEIQPNFIHD